MRKRSFVLLSVCLVALSTLILQGNTSLVAHQRRAPIPGASQAKLVEAYGKLPLSFEANQGQTGSEVKFLSRGSGYSLFLTANEAVLSLKPSRDRKGAVAPARLQNKPGPLAAARGSDQAPESAVLRMKLAGANPSAQVAGVDELPGKSNYFLGNDPAKWRTNVPTYAKVKYAEVYPGIDLVYYGNQRQLEYDFVVAPGADPQSIRLSFAVSNPSRDSDGAVPLRIDAQGDLIARVGGDEIRLRKPVVYQEVNGERRPVSGGYVFQANNDIRFSLAAYDKTKPLVVDPVLVYATYLGGNDIDVGYGIAVDSSGNAYVTGQTLSTNFPPANPFRIANGGGYDAFVTKLNVSGSALIYSTYLGGSAFDFGQGIAVDSSGNAYVTGETSSTNFPTANAIQTRFGGANTDAFVAKLNAAGSALVYSTYLGGNGQDYGTGIAVDSSGNAYVTGETLSTDFPTANAFQASFGAGKAFVTKFNAAGSALVYSTYLGGSSGDRGQGIAVDSSGNAFVTGWTRSTDFPTANSFQARNGGGLGDVFVTKFNASGSALVYSTYLGGSGQDISEGIAVDSFGNACVTGYTESTDFPTANAFQARYGGGGDGFVTEFNAAGSTPVYSTYLGGSGVDQGSGVAVDSSGSAYVTGPTSSTNFPTANAIQAVLSGSNDAFVMKLNAVGSALVYSTYLGGSGSDGGSGIAVDPSGNAYMTGSTGSTNFPTANAFRSAYGGGVQDAFVAKISDNTQLSNPVPAVSALSPPSAAAGGAAFTLTVVGSNFISGATVQWNGSNRSTIFVSSTQLAASIAASDIATTGTAQVSVFNPGPGGGVSSPLSFSINAPGTNPVPILTSLSTPTPLVGGIGYQMTVNGSNFVSGSVVQWNGSSRSTTFISTTQLTATLTAADVQGGTAQVTVFNPAPGGGVSNALSYPPTVVTNPVPAISFISPNNALAGGAAFGLSVSGSNFVTGAVVQWNGSNRTTTFVSSTQLTASIAAADIATAGTARVTVFNPSPGGGISNAAGFTISAVAGNPVPAVSVLFPASAVAGGAGVTINVNGSNFISSSLVLWNGVGRATAFVSTTLLTVTIPPADIARAGTAQVSVFNTSPGGGFSNAFTFTITPAPPLNPVPAISALTPSLAFAGAAGFTLTVTGSRFISDSVVQWNGSDRPTTVNSSTQLSAAISAADVASTGTARVTVVNPSPGGGSSNAANFVIQSPSGGGIAPGVDLTVWRPSDGTWYVVSSSNLFLPTTVQWGATGDIPVPGDYDGDRKSDFAIWRPSNGTWYILRRAVPDPSLPITGQWGAPGDIPVPGDYDGDGRTDIAVWRPSEGNWYIVFSGTPFASGTSQWGTVGDIPVPGDYDGDGRADIAVWRPSVGVWFIIRSSGADNNTPLALQWGTQGDIPVPGDYDGDGKADFGVWRPSTGTWFILRSTNPNPNAPLTRQWGAAGDVPVPGDYDGDGKTDMAVWRPSEGNWYVVPSSSPNSLIVIPWGTAGDTPLFTVNK